MPKITLRIYGNLAQKLQKEAIQEERSKSEMLRVILEENYKFAKPKEKGNTQNISTFISGETLKKLKVKTLDEYGTVDKKATINQAVNMILSARYTGNYGEKGN